MTTWATLVLVVAVLATYAMVTTLGWAAALVVPLAVALGTAAGRLYLYLRLRGRFDALAYLANEAVVVLDEDYRVLYASPSTEQVFGRRLDDERSLRAGDLVHPDDAVELGRATRAARAQRGGTYSATFRLRHRTKGWRWLDVSGVNLLHDPSVGGIVSTARDVTDRIEAEDASQRAQHDASRFQAIIESTSDTVLIIDSSRHLLFANRAARRTLDIGPSPDLGALEPADFFTPASWKLLEVEALPTALEQGVWNGDLEFRRPSDGLVVLVSQVLLAQRNARGEVEFIACVGRDMTDQKQLEARLKHQADHDELTGLPSRKPLISYLEVALANNRRFGGRVTALFLDVDRFKVVNDSLGHQAGDQLLVEFAKRLVAAVRPQDRSGRFGGDEFVVILPDVEGPNEAAQVADRIREQVGGRYQLGDEEVHVSASIGVALAVGQERPEELLRDADAAMYEAKARGRDRVQLFDGAMRLQVVERLDIEQALRRALDRGELRLHYQPLVDIPTGRVRGVEALVRWQHPTRGLLLPGQFLPVAEETGLIVDLGTWVLQEACEQATTWGIDPLTGTAIPVFVNLSARQLADAHLLTKVRDVVACTGLDAGTLHLEITEDALMADAGTTIQTLESLRAIGVRLAIDDFGTGYSSLSYLKHFPVDVLKIDKSFVEGLGSDAGDAAITAAIVEVAQRLGLVTVAEGVERVDQAEWLVALGCDFAQGYHFARPMRAEELDLVLLAAAV